LLSSVSTSISKPFILIKKKNAFIPRDISTKWTQGARALFFVSLLYKIATNFLGNNLKQKIIFYKITQFFIAAFLLIIKENKNTKMCPLNV
jgi:hypothetical protein